jgi:hypothetical protein
MTAKAAILSLATLLIGLVPCADKSHASLTALRDQPCIVLKISELRSAYLQRAGVVCYDESHATPDGLRQQLQHHFDVVLGLLGLATPDSIETALSRLEAADDHTWTAEERTAWRQQLQAARRVQFQRLAAYRDRGIFPLNEGQSAHPVPIFVDRHRTACAVGHLMRCSGCANEVDAIAESNNLAYVPDAAQSPVPTWVLTSGLTLEEAALIQPGYYWPAGQFDASAYEPGEAALEKDGLRFSNFRLQVHDYIIVSGDLFPIDLFTDPKLAGLGLSTAKGTFPNTRFPEHVPMGTNWIAIGGSTSYLQAPLHSLRARTDNVPGRPNVYAQQDVIDFDVAPVAADQRINGISESSYSDWQGFQDLSLTSVPPAGSVYSLKTTALDGATALASLNIDQSTQGPYSSRNADTRLFDPRQQISVETTLFLQNRVAMDTYLLDFNVVSVPEPTSAFLTAVLVTTYGLTRAREHS